MMELLLIAGALLAVFCVQWLLCRALLTPLPPQVSCVYDLDGGADALEYAVRGYRYLCGRGLMQGRFVIVMSTASEDDRAAAALLAKSGEILLIEKETGSFAHNEGSGNGTEAGAAQRHRLRGAVSE